MPQPTGESSGDVYFDADLAKDTLYALSTKTRRSISWLIKGAHNLDITYIQAYQLERKDCTYNKETGLYSVIIKKGHSDPVVIKILSGITAQKLYPMNMWWDAPSRPTSLVTLKFIRSLLDVLGIALSEDGRAVGFFDDSEALDDPIIQSQLLTQKTK